MATELITQGKQISFYLTASECRALEEYAAATDRPISRIVREAIRDLLDKDAAAD